jgi:hypothetical protein
MSYTPWVPMPPRTERRLSEILTQVFFPSSSLLAILKYPMPVVKENLLSE